MRIPAVVFWVVLVLALLELRSEVKLLAQHFTWTGLLYAVIHHKLACLIVVLSPWWLLSSTRHSSSRFP